MDSSGFFWIALLSQQFLAKMTKFRKFERKKKLSIFWRALPTKTFFSFPRPTEGRPRKKKSGLSKGAENALKLVRFAMANEGLKAESFR